MLWHREAAGGRLLFVLASDVGPCDSSSAICQELGDQLWFVDLPGVDLLNLRKAAAVMARTNKREMCHWETNESHRKTRTRPLLVRHRA